MWIYIYKKLPGRAGSWVYGPIGWVEIRGPKKQKKKKQREQSLQEAKLIKWESGERIVRSKKSIERDERILLLVGDYENRDITTYVS